MQIYINFSEDFFPVDFINSICNLYYNKQFYYHLFNNYR